MMIGRATPRTVRFAIRRSCRPNNTRARSNRLIEAAARGVDGVCWTRPRLSTRPVRSRAGFRSRWERTLRISDADSGLGAGPFPHRIHQERLDLIRGAIDVEVLDRVHTDP